MSYLMLQAPSLFYGENDQEICTRAKIRKNTISRYRLQGTNYFALPTVLTYRYGLYSQEIFDTAHVSKVEERPLIRTKMSPKVLVNVPLPTRISTNVTLPSKMRKKLLPKIHHPLP